MAVLPPPCAIIHICQYLNFSSGPPTLGPSGTHVHSKTLCLWDCKPLKAQLHLSSSARPSRKLAVVSDLVNLKDGRHKWQSLSSNQLQMIHSSSSLLKVRII